MNKFYMIFLSVFVFASANASSVIDLYEKVDLLEQDERPLDVIDGKIKIPVSNFEIITLRLEKGV